MHKKSKAEEIAMALRDHALKYGLPLLKKTTQSNDFQEEALKFGDPAQQFDIVEVTEGPYKNECKAGERFIALEVLSGDHTVISMKSDGSWISLCYPEEYIVVGNVEEFSKEWKKEAPGECSEIKYLVKPRKDIH